jgi:hypothetical protein
MPIFGLIFILQILCRIFQEICQEERFAPRYARRLQKEWFALARREAAQ